MAKQYQLDRLRIYGVATWNQWREQNPNVKIDLEGADLAGLNLAGVNLSNANLRGVNLARADLRNANLRGSDLRPGLRHEER